MNATHTVQKCVSVVNVKSATVKLVTRPNHMAVDVHSQIVSNTTLDTFNKFFKQDDEYLDARPDMHSKSPLLSKDDWPKKNLLDILDQVLQEKYIIDEMYFLKQFNSSAFKIHVDSGKNNDKSKLYKNVIIPLESAEYLVNVSKYIDFELQKFFGKQSFYNLKNTQDLLGHLVIGLAPHTSVGITGRLIGYTKTHVCFASPIWHSAKRRDADGDADSVMLLLDALLNFSRQFLSDKIGGLMDAPLLIQPIVFPHEAQTQAHNFEVTKKFPLAFYESTSNHEKSGDIRNIETF